MEWFIDTIVSNLLVAGLIAVLALVAQRFIRRPQYAHALWLLVLVKLITPPVVQVRLPEWQSSPANFVATEMPLVNIEPAPAHRGPRGNEGTNEHINEQADEQNTEGSAALIVDRMDSTDVQPADVPTVAQTPSVTAQPAESGNVPTRRSLAQLPWPAILAGQWMIGSIGFVLLTVCSWLRFHRLLRYAEPGPPQVEATLQQLADRMGVKRTPRILFLNACVPPMVWQSFSQPLILVPAKLFCHLSVEQQRTVLAHELAHIRRRDHWVRWIELFSLSLFWWYPVAWFASRKMREAEEQCCDAWVVWALPENRRSYGEALSATVDFLAADQDRLPALMGGQMGKYLFKRRVEMIVKHELTHSMSWLGRIAIVLIAILALPLAATSVQSSATAQQDRRRADSAADETQDDDERGKRSALDLLDDDDRDDDDRGWTPLVRGVVMASVDVRLTSRRPGAMEQLTVKEGAVVKRGDVIARIDNAELAEQVMQAEGELALADADIQTAELQVRIAMSELKVAELEYKRMQQLLEKKAISQAEVARMEANMEKAQLSRESAELQLRSAKLRMELMKNKVRGAQRAHNELLVRAPADGVIVEVLATSGATVKTGDKIARLVGLDKLSAEAYLEEESADRVKVGDDVLIETRGRTGIKLRGKVAFISPVTDVVSGSVRFRVDFDNLRRRGNFVIRPGMQVVISVVADDDDDDDADDDDEDDEDDRDRDDDDGVLYEDDR